MCLLFRIFRDLGRSLASFGRSVWELCAYYLQFTMLIVGSTLLTVMAAMFTLYLCIRFLTSATSNPRAEESRLYRNDSGALRDTKNHCGFFAKACPLLGLLAAGLVVVVGAWVSDGRLWHRWSATPPSASNCTHCEGYEENRRQAEEADEKVRQADRSKQQFMAYVFHNIRGAFVLSVRLRVRNMCRPLGHLAMLALIFLSLD